MPKPFRALFGFAHYQSIRGPFLGCSILIKMPAPNAINGIDIETFPMIAKHIEI